MRPARQGEGRATRGGEGLQGEGRGYRMTHRAASNALLKGVNVVGMVPSSHEGVLCGDRNVGAHTLLLYC